MNVFCHIPREDWIVDRMGIEYSKYSSHNVNFQWIEDDSLIWLFASWCWNQIPISFLEKRKVLCTVHHEVPWKFDEKRKENFLARDKYVDVYHTYTEETKCLIQKLSSKPVVILPHWVNDKIWFFENKKKAKHHLDLPLDRFIIGSFQRDTEGSDLKTPKLEKGPDVFLKVVEHLSKNKNVHVLLGGWRRQYVISGLDSLDIDYTYIELPDQSVINQMYNACDLYVVGSRCEGGPQSLFECAITKTPIISTPVGQAKLILEENQIYEISEKIDNLDISDQTEKNHKKIQKYCIENHIKNYDRLIKNILTGEKF